MNTRFHSLALCAVACVALFAWLGGQKRRVARVMLTTLQNRTCVSFKCTDPEQKPTWKEVMPPARMQMMESEIAKFENSDMRRDSSCA